MLGKDLKYALDPVYWANDALSTSLDPWQVHALESTATQSLWNIHRQAGKSSVAAMKALHKSVYYPGSLTLMVSKSERQSGELYRKFLGYYDRLDNPPPMPEDKALSCTLGNGSRVVALPGIEDTIRSFSSVALIIEDEASRVPDELYIAIRPMLAISKGTIILMSTPNGKVGHFFNTWNDNIDPNTFQAKAGSPWDIIRVQATECPRISQAFLDNERLNMSENEYNQEYMCEFCDLEGAVFSSDLFRSLVDPNLKPFKLEDA